MASIEYTEKLRLEKQKLGDVDHKQKIVLDNMSLWQSVIVYDTALVDYRRVRHQERDLPPTSK